MRIKTYGMIKPYIKQSGLLSLLFVGLASLSGCGLFGGGAKGGGDMGELVGVGEREGWVMTTPYGMVPIPAGTFHMGQADEDVGATQINHNKQVTIGNFFMDDTEITNNEFRQFITSVLEDSASTLGEQFIRDNYYPDTTVFTKDFTHHMGDPLQEYYFWHPAYDNYPVVGVNWEAAKVFCQWRTEYLNDYRSSVGEWPMPNFRLPSEAEWEYAARGGEIWLSTHGVTHTYVIVKDVCLPILNLVEVIIMMTDLRIRLQLVFILPMITTCTIWQVMFQNGLKMLLTRPLSLSFGI